MTTVSPVSAYDTMSDQLTDTHTYFILTNETKYANTSLYKNMLLLQAGEAITYHTLK